MFPCLLQLPNQHFVEFWVIYEGLHHFVFDLRALKIALFVCTHTTTLVFNGELPNQFYLNLWTMSILKIVYSCKYLRLIWNYREL